MIKRLNHFKCILFIIVNFPYSHSKSLAEEYVLAAGDESLRVISLRPASIWGKGDLIDRILGKAANLNQFGWFEQGDYLFSTCYIDNLCAAVQNVVRLYAETEAQAVQDVVRLYAHECAHVRCNMIRFYAQ